MRRRSLLNAGIFALTAGINTFLQLPDDARHTVYAKITNEVKKGGRFYGRVWYQERDANSTKDWKLIVTEKFTLNTALSEEEAESLILESMRIIHRSGSTDIMEDSIRVCFYRSVS